MKKPVYVEPENFFPKKVRREFKLGEFSGEYNQKKTVTKIVIKGESGYCSAEEAYRDKVILTKEGISYAYTPDETNKFHPALKWSFKTNNFRFREAFDEIAELTEELLQEECTDFCTDIGSTEITVIYDDKSKFSKIYWVDVDYFENIFGRIRTLVPDVEDIPEVLKTGEDFEEEE